MPPRVSETSKRIRGTFRPSRDAKPPRTTPGTPTPPEWLSQAALPRWRELVEELGPTKVLTTSDRTALGLLADVLTEYTTHRATIDAEGATYAKGSRGRATLRRPRPEVTLAREARRDAVRLLEAFGLTPASRHRVTAPEEPEGFDELEKFLFKARA